jgi:hypothetical protein
MKPAETELSCSALKMHMLASTSQLWEPSGIRIEETDEGLTLGEKLLWRYESNVLGKIRTEITYTWRQCCVHGLGNAATSLGLMVENGCPHYREPQN